MPRRRESSTPFVDTIGTAWVFCPICRSTQFGVRENVNTSHHCYRCDVDFLMKRTATEMTISFNPGQVKNLHIKESA